jgi:hypothetical protein
MKNQTIFENIRRRAKVLQAGAEAKGLKLAGLPDEASILLPDGTHVRLTEEWQGRIARYVISRKGSRENLLWKLNQLR